MNVNELAQKIANNYILVGAAAVLFFAAKAVTAYLTYRHYNRKLARLEKKLDELIGGKSADGTSLPKSPR